MRYYSMFFATEQGIQCHLEFVQLFLLLFADDVVFVSKRIIGQQYNAVKNNINCQLRQHQSYSFKNGGFLSKYKTSGILLHTVKKYFVLVLR